MFSTLLIIIITIILIVTIFIEINYRGDMHDHPHCNYVLTYCNKTAERNNIKLILKEPENDQHISLLLDKLSEKMGRSDVVFWRLCVIMATFLTIIYYIFNYYANIQIPTFNYIFLLFLLFSSTYWILNHYQFHLIEAVGFENQLIISTVKDYINKFQNK